MLLWNQTPNSHRIHIVKRHGCLCCARFGCLAAMTPLWQQPDPSALWQPSCWWMIPLLPDAIASRTISPALLKPGLFGQRTCEVGGWMETWSQWLNELLCMMERLACCTRGLEVVDVGLAYHEDKVYCSTERVSSCWCIWLICFSIDVFYWYTVFLKYRLR